MARSISKGDFEWDEVKARENARKHKVLFEEAMTAFLDPRGVDAPDLIDTSRAVLIGRSGAARVLFVVYALAGERLRLISARLATRRQRRVYEEEG